MDRHCSKSQTSRFYVELPLAADILTVLECDNKRIFPLQTNLDQRLRSLGLQSDARSVLPWLGRQHLCHRCHCRNYLGSTSSSLSVDYPIRNLNKKEKNQKRITLVQQAAKVKLLKSCNYFIYSKFTFTSATHTYVDSNKSHLL